MNVLITGSIGLVGYECSTFFINKGASIHGVDNDMRKNLFGSMGSGNVNLTKLKQHKKYTHHDIDIRDSDRMESLFKLQSFDVIIHAAAQPSHDYASQIPFDDFNINATSTVNLLELTRKYCPEAAFCYASTNKVYGTNVNNLPIVEEIRRFEYATPNLFKSGIDEKLSIDHTLHSLMGASKLSADIYVQEYGRYFGLKTACFRCGCITGGRHSGVELHGFLNYIVKQALTGGPYTIFGYKGKQVRDHIHALDLANAFYKFANHPKQGSVYNMGGGYDNSVSILEVIDKLEQRDLKLSYSIHDYARIGDHQCYYSNLSSFKKDYPTWSIAYDIDELINEIIEENS